MATDKYIFGISLLINLFISLLELIKDPLIEHPLKPPNKRTQV